MIRLFSFDRNKSFRNHPWLYGLVSGLGIGIGILTMLLAVFSSSSRFVSRQHQQIIESPQEKEDRLIIMNIVNKLNLDENSVSSKTSQKERLKQRQTHVELAIGRLNAVTTSGTLLQAKQELVDLFKKWDSYLIDNKDTLVLRDQFIVIANKYIWLNKVVWILILNRL